MTCGRRRSGVRSVGRLRATRKRNELSALSKNPDGWLSVGFAGQSITDRVGLISLKIFPDQIGVRIRHLPRVHGRPRRSAGRRPVGRFPRSRQSPRRRVGLAGVAISGLRGRGGETRAGGLVAGLSVMSRGGILDGLIGVMNRRHSLAGAGVGVIAIGG
jgi:hypothetical protein